MTSPLILQAFRRPDQVITLDLPQWDLLIRQARKANLLASLHARLDGLGLLGHIPVQPRQHLSWANTVANRHGLAVRHEVALIHEALANCGAPIILLKGAAYVMAQLSCARGRLFSDIDILVPKDKLDEVEAALMLHGWATTHHDAYDQRYYRTWMHELPPMRHIRRMTVIDVHHAIVPETASIHPDPALLRAAALPIEDEPGLLTLAPADMILHSAVHLFHDGELENGLRDLVDLQGLLQQFSMAPEFWPRLIERAIQLELARPLFYALRYLDHMLHAPIPNDAMECLAKAAAPNKTLLAMMDSFFLRALLPAHASCSDALSNFAREMLYIRANWLRMPPLMLARHLFHKAVISPKTEK
ncbi:putative nucleotidyltransferase-like protein [Paucimonas lemoignei]|uniref:Putative nucleotidyltransferase-like protein n=1 Tax=Paucimonas lemoignei TaxID=29443 RepID=A0A4R3HZA7_PAULE|nr:nucleotidyltransferase family protein [Paucimonas lemoignei]TCS38582.1 putative nucleotidyltransferase-like protein [Paucimonas lemoignei]